MSLRTISVTVHGAATCGGRKQTDNAVLLTPTPDFIGWIN
jgi:hypothetical protein